MDSGPEPDLPELFLRTSKRIRRNQMTGLTPLGLTPSQARALRIIGHATDPLRMSALAERLDIVPRSATTVVDALESAGLVTRAPDPANRRSILVAATDAGRDVLSRMARARRRAAEDLFATLTPSQRDTLRDLLAALDSDETN
ncbi:MarR family transcriptional regulator [Nocardia sp. NPDC050710]|uniref:MarR family winged helix-turn-helix transcriptional regulator n=1 Tax=Nocardia sp. NPDC050710 TaxID=3157220 RepID=UPI0033DA8D19